uniref:C2H2-type domain-containing protein n=1 Tax=Cyprinus carpio TaxID=7962 RepID=A0A8C1GIF6_CYPCA
MEFIKEEREDVKIEETLRVKQEDTEEQTDLMLLKEECIVPNEMEEEEQFETRPDFKTEEESFSWLQIKETFSQKTAHKTGTKSYFTPLHCEKSFGEHGNLKVPMKIHTGGKTFSCQQCGKRFNRKGHLNDHMRVHTGEKSFFCQQCGKSFKHKGDLNRHMRIHTGEKSFTCQQCGVSFTHKGNLQVHMRIHTGEKPYTCQQCGVSFTNKGNLYRHMKIHTGGKSYICQQCGVSITHEGNLQEHILNHTATTETHTNSLHNTIPNSTLERRLTPANSVESVSHMKENLKNT